MEIVGIIKNVRPLITKTGATVVFATLEKQKDVIDLIFFPQVWEQCKNYIEEGKETTLQGEIKYFGKQSNFVVKVS